MGRSKPKFSPNPRIFNLGQVLAILNKGDDWWKRHRFELENHGFPLYDSLLSGWDADAISVWMDKRSGLNVKIKDDTPNFDTLTLSEAISARTS